MHARRSRIIALSVVLATIGALAPLALMGYASWKLAIDKELKVLDRTGEDAIARAQFTFTDARKALVDIEASDVARCSPAHIALMRMLTINTSSVEEIGYFDNGKLRCTSWGPTEGDIGKAHVDYVTPDGLQVTLRIKPAVTRGKPMVGLHLGSHNALVTPSRFVDIGLGPDISLALTNSAGHLIDGRNGPDVDFARGHLEGKAHGIDGSEMFATVAQDGLVAVVTEPVTKVYERLRGELLLLLPVGSFIAAFIVALVVFFSRRRLSPRGELEIGIHRREFIVHYQPIVELSTGVCVGAEALVRWQWPSGTMVRPDLFIPLAEETGLIAAITDQIVDGVISDLGRTLEEDRSLHIAINISADDIKTGRFLDMVSLKLQKTGIRNEQIWFEATERGFIDIDAARVSLDLARKAGHSVAIDDFGTGYSSLQYLQGLPMDALKIDKSFIDTIGKGTATSSVTSHIIEMAKELGLFTVAEGVETEEQASYLREHGVTFGQGWLFSKPLPAAEFIKFHAASVAKHGRAAEVIRVAA